MKCLNKSNPQIANFINMFGEVKASKLLDMFPEDYVPSVDEMLEKYRELEKNSLTQLATNINKPTNRKFKIQDVFRVEPIKGADTKAVSKAFISTQYIGFADGISGSSTGAYANQIIQQGKSELVNSGNYSSSDVIFVSVPGKRGSESIRREQQNRTIREAIKAIEAGATLITDNKSYVESSDYNEGEKRLAKNLEAKGYVYREITILHNVLGVWAKPIESETTTPRPIENNSNKNAINAIFENTPELASLGTPELYAQYLDTIFPNSKVKDIVYHGNRSGEIIEDFKFTGVNKLDQNAKAEDNTGIFFTDDAYVAATYGDGSLKNNYKVILDIKNPIYPDTETVTSKSVGKYIGKHDGVIGQEPNHPGTNLVVFEPKQIHILGSKKDIERFKNWVSAQINTVEENVKSDIYSQLGNITQSENVVITSWSELRDKPDAVFNNQIVSTRIIDNDEHFGNPFSSDEKVLAKNKSLIKTSSTKESVEKYIDWILNENTNEIKGINIRSDKTSPNSLSNKLTNPNWYAKNLFDVESNYKANASKIKAPQLNTEEALKYDMNLMYQLQLKKFRQNPELIDEINAQGGLEFIKQSSHIVGVKSSRWEGKGMESNFIKVLAKSYETVAKELNKFVKNSNIEPQRREWIREQLKSGKLKGLPILYFKELGEPSHATALDYLINKYDWAEEKITKEEVVEPVIEEGYTRLYRSENETGLDSAPPNWLTEQPEYQEMQDAVGRWFYKSYEEAKYHAEKFGSSDITYIDVPTDQVESFNAKDNKFGGGYAKDGKEYFVSRELANTRKSLKVEKQEATEEEFELIKEEPKGKQLSLFEKKEKFQLTEEQRIALDAASDFIDNGNPNEWFVVEGKAGTGKTTIIQELVNRYGSAHISTMSHQALKVVRSKTKGNIYYHTLAGLLGQKRELETNTWSKQSIGPNTPINFPNLIIIDEASMVKDDVLKFILENKKRNAKVILFADPGQLGPIYSDQDIAANPTISNNKSSIFDTPNKARLTVRIRQGEESPILPIADYFWNTENKALNPKPLPANKREDLLSSKGSVVFSDKLADNMLTDILELFKKGMRDRKEYVKLVVYRNEPRQTLNKAIHEKIFGQTDTKYVEGEMITFFYSYGEVIKNSDVGYIETIGETRTNQQGFEYNIMRVNIDGNPHEISVIAESSKLQFNQYVAKLKSDADKLTGANRGRAFVKAYEYEETYANIDYGYAVTAYKVQGSEYDVIVALEDDLRIGSRVPVKYYESMYTTITRAKKVAVILSSEHKRSTASISELLKNDREVKKHTKVGKYVKYNNDAYIVAFQSPDGNKLTLTQIGSKKIISANLSDVSFIEKETLVVKKNNDVYAVEENISVNLHTGEIVDTINVEEPELVEYIENLDTAFTYELFRNEVYNQQNVDIVFEETPKEILVKRVKGVSFGERLNAILDKILTNLRSAVALMMLVPIMSTFSGTNTNVISNFDATTIEATYDAVSEIDKLAKKNKFSQSERREIIAYASNKNITFNAALLDAYYAVSKNQESPLSKHLSDKIYEMLKTVSLTNIYPDYFQDIILEKEDKIDLGVCKAGAECAAYVQDVFQATPEILNSLPSFGIYGNAWKMPTFVVKNNGVMLYNVFDNPSYNINNVPASVQHIKSLIDLHTFDAEYSPMEGDIVGLFYRSSGNHMLAYSENKEARINAFNTHIGFIRFVNGIPVVEHNIHGKVYQEKLADVIKNQSVTGIKIASIARTNYTKNATKSKKIGLAFNPPVYAEYERGQAFSDHARSILAVAQKQTKDPLVIAATYVIAGQESSFGLDVSENRTANELYEFVWNVSHGHYQVQTRLLDNYGIQYQLNDLYDLRASTKIAVELIGKYIQDIQNSPNAEQFEQLSFSEKVALLAYVHNRGIGRYVEEGGLNNITNRMKEGPLFEKAIYRTNYLEIPNVDAKTELKVLDIRLPSDRFSTTISEEAIGKMQTMECL